MNASLREMVAPPLKMTEAQRLQLQTIFDAMAKHRTTMRYLHFRSESMETRKDLTSGSTTSFPQPSCVEVWADEWTMRYRLEYRPYVGWNGWDKPYWIQNKTESNDEEFYRAGMLTSNSLVSSSRVSWTNLAHIENYLGISTEHNLLLMLNVALRNGYLHLGAIKLDLAEIDRNGSKVWEVRLSSLTMNRSREREWQQMIYCLDPKKECSLVYYEGGKPLSGGATAAFEPAKWTVVEMGQTNEGQYYPKRYRQVSQNQFDGKKQEITEETTVTFLEVLPALPKEIRNVPKSQ